MMSDDGAAAALRRQRQYKQSHERLINSNSDYSVGMTAAGPIEVNTLINVHNCA